MDDNENKFVIMHDNKKLILDMEEGLPDAKTQTFEREESWNLSSGPVDIILFFIL